MPDRPLNFEAFAAASSALPSPPTWAVRMSPYLAPSCPAMSVDGVLGARSWSMGSPTGYEGEGSVQAILRAEGINSSLHEGNPMTEYLHQALAQYQAETGDQTDVEELPVYLLYEVIRRAKRMKVVFERCEAYDTDGLLTRG